MNKNILKSFVIFTALLSGLTGCGGGGGESVPPANPVDTKITVSGTVQKGQFNSLFVNARTFDPGACVFQPGAPAWDPGACVFSEPLPVEVKDQHFSVQLEPNQTLLLEATGEFVNDVTGDPVMLDQPLRTLVNVEQQDAAANINLLTTIVTERTLQQLPSSSLPIAELIDQQETFVNEVFGLPAATQPDQLDFANIRPDSLISDPNLVLLLTSAGISETLTGDQLFADGFSDLLDTIVNAGTTADAASALDILNTFGANAIYSAVKINASYTFLPDLQLSDSPIFICLENAGCNWQPQTGPTVSVDARSIYESYGQVSVVVRLGEVSTSVVKVNIATASDTATEAVDFLRLEQQLEFAPGETKKEFQIGIVIDNLAEPIEDISVSISSLTPAYSVLQDKVKISVLDGAPPTFANQTVSDMSIRSLDLPFLCLASGDCGPLDNSSTLGLVADSIITVMAELALEVLCAPAIDCTQRDKDWLVDFYLVAKDNSDARQAEVPLGSYIYKLDTQGNTPRFPILGIGGGDVETLAQNANNNGWSLEVEARLGPPDISLARQLKPIVLLPSSVIAGNTVIPLDSVINITDGVDAGCQQGEYSIEARYQVAEIPQLGAITQTGSLCVDLDATDPAANPATVVDGSIILSDTVLPLPSGASFRFSNPVGSIFASESGFESYPFLPLSILERTQVYIDPNWSPGLQAYMQLINDAVADLKVYLHAEGWPFELDVDNVTLSAAGIVIAYRDTRYLMDHDYSDQDPRANGRLYSNDIYYSGATGQAGTLILNPDGLEGSINVAQSSPDSANTAFPKAGIEWQAFTQAIDQNRLQPVQLNVSSYKMQQATACSEPGCDGDLPQSWEVIANNVKLDGDGFMLGDALNERTDQIVKFGAIQDDKFAWSRPDDLRLQQTVKLAVPGYVMPADARVSDYLLTHLNDTQASENLARYPLGSDAFIDGNYHPVGLSIGPEIYRNAAQGIPEKGDGQDLSTSDNKLTINNGEDAPFNLISSPGVKYVLRNAGLTGVFNVASSSLGAGNSPQFYGYPLNLSRFAVRATDNKLDTYTWIDGTLALNNEAGGPDGLDVWFSNMEINCAARLGNVDLLYEACDSVDNNDNSIIDENCAPQLFAWKAETDIFAAGFSGADDTLACATGGQNFTLDHQLFFEALNKPVAFQTQWDPHGFLVAQTSGELPVYRFDRSDEGKGFPIKTRSAKLGVGKLGGNGDDYGWLELTQTRLGVPFWNAFEADVRVANQQQFAELVAEPTVVLPIGQLDVQQQAAVNTETNKQLLQRTIDIGKGTSPEAEAVNINAQYNWGNTGFSFNLPVYYQPYQLDSGNNDVDAQGRQSRFIGRTLSKDLFVMDANAGINFVEPKRTKLSFGASADFERLGSLSFQIDLNDPDSAGAVDDLLISLKVINDPLLEPALTEFLDSINVINRFANRGLDEVVQEGLQLAVKETGQAVAPLTPNNQDPFVTASEALAMVRSGPQQAITILVDEIRKPLDNSLFVLEQQLRNEISNLESAVNNPLLTKQQVLAQVDKVIDTVNKVAEQAAAVDTKIDDTVARAQSLLSQALNKLTDLKTASETIDQVILQSVSFVESSCSAGFVPSAEGNGYLDKVAIRFAEVRKLADIIRNSNGMFAVAESLATDNEQKRRLNTSKRRIQEAVTELLGFVATAESAVLGAVCSASDIDDVTSKALVITGRIRTDADTASFALTEAMVDINKISLLHEKLSATIINPVIELSTALDLARNLVAEDKILVADMFIKADCILLQLLSNGEDTCSVPPDEPYVVDALIDEVFVTAQGGVNDIISDAENKLIASLDSLLPGAFMTPQQMREMLVAEIMNSAPIKDMRTQMDKHFSEISYAVNGIALQYLDQLNLVIQNALASVTGPVNDALAAASSAVREMPLQAAGIDGYATIAGNELERAHIGAAWTMRGTDDDSATDFRAALDAESWSARNIGSDPNDGLTTPTACAVADTSSLLDVKISAYGLPIRILAADIELEKLYLGFTLEQNTGNIPPLVPVGIFGGINTMGQIGFTDAIVINPAFAAGLGLQQSYIGASAAAKFSSLEADVAFMVGRVCPGNTVLTDLDPDVAKFLPSMPPAGFTGAYLRGGATIPLIPGGCALNVGVSADFGSWLFIGQPTTLGGLVGGGAIGQVACIASIRGKVRVAGTVNTDGDLKLGGEAWGVAGAGFDCDPGTWTSVRRSRGDDWCGTGDVQIDAGFENGDWDLSAPRVDSIF